MNPLKSFAKFAARFAAGVAALPLAVVGLGVTVASLIVFGVAETVGGLLKGVPVVGKGGGAQDFVSRAGLRGAMDGIKLMETGLKAALYCKSGNRVMDALERGGRDLELKWSGNAYKG